MGRFDQGQAAGRANRGRAGTKATDFDPRRQADAQITALLERLRLPGAGEPRVVWIVDRSLDI